MGKLYFKKWVSIINNSPSRDFITTDNQSKVSTTTNQRDFITTSKRVFTTISKIRDFITISVIPPKKSPKKLHQKSTTQLPGKETNMLQSLWMPSSTVPQRF